MKYILSFPTPLSEVNAVDDNVDVLVTTEDGREYTFVIATPNNLTTLMEKEALPYLKPGAPFLFVKELSEDNIRLLLDDLMEEDRKILEIYGNDFNQA